MTPAQAPWHWVETYFDGESFYWQALDTEDGEGILLHSAMWPIDEAYARLIAAAPELLDTLRLVARRYEENDFEELAYRAVLAAIAEATGG